MSTVVAIPIWQRRIDSGAAVRKAIVVAITFVAVAASLQGVTSWASRPTADPSLLREASTEGPLSRSSSARRAPLPWMRKRWSGGSAEPSLTSFP